MELRKCDEALTVSELSLDRGLYNSSVSSGYYAVLHAAKAVLLTRRIEAFSHNGVINKFALNFVKEGKFDKRFSRLLGRLRKAREDGEYKTTVIYTKEEATLRIEEAREFVEEMKRFLRSESWRRINQEGV
ncbi:MAG: HEPN domain-containing protein [bacterium]|nr:HEPN domain-containing protein [bacterium]